MRPTALIRRSRGFGLAAKLCRQYLRWFGNASFKPERNGERWLLESLRDQGIRTVMDVGATSSWALLAARSLPDATIYALEVVPPTAAALRTATAGEQRIRCFDIGLAAHTGTLTMNYHPRASTHATFTDYPDNWAGEALECRVMRGDEFLAQERISEVGLLKHDVEGAEYLALQGLEEAVRARRIRLVQFEYGRVNILTHFLLRDFYELFRSHGYVVGKIFPNYVDFRDYQLDDEDFLGPNYLACQAGDELVVRLRGG